MCNSNSIMSWFSIVEFSLCSSVCLFYRFKVVYEYFESHFIYLEMYAHWINLCFISKWQNFWGITNWGQECKKLKIFPKTDSKLFMDKSLMPRLPTKCKLCPGKALADFWLRKMSEPSPAPPAAHKDRIFHFLRKQDEKDSRRLEDHHKIWPEL